MTIELICRQERHRAVRYIDGWLEADPSQLVDLFNARMIDLSTLDPRLAGSAAIPQWTSGSGRCQLKVSGPVAVEGRQMNTGDRVRIETGGEVFWNS